MRQQELPFFGSLYVSPDHVGEICLYLDLCTSAGQTSLPAQKGQFRSKISQSEGCTVLMPLFPGDVASFDNHQEITDLRPQILSPFRLLFRRQLELKGRVRDGIFNEINDIGWLHNLREVVFFPVKKYPSLGKKQSFALRDLPQGFPLSSFKNPGGFRKTDDRLMFHINSHSENGLKPLNQGGFGDRSAALSHAAQ